jgi:uncharacterized protein (TIGR02453 family)
VTRTVAPRYPPQALTFLRALKRNNRRDWFNAHRDDYETHVKQPTLAIIERLADDFRSFAPEVVASPKSSMYRIYRDTRFSENKTPYKTHVAASFPTRGLPKGEGAGLYFHVALDGVWIGGGVYAPPPPALYAIREHIAAHTKRLRAIVDSPLFRKGVGAIEGEKLQRVPRGFPKDHPAADILRFKQFFAGRELAPAVATGPRFYPALLSVFRQIIPLVRFLNEPLT